MEFVYRRGYRGTIKAVVLDWAGTTVDYGCIAPVIVFVEAFRQQGVDITMTEARAPMGMRKNDHIREITRMQRVREAWQHLHGRLPNDDDVQRMYEQFMPMQTEIIADYADPIPGTLEAMSYFQGRGIKVGSCTGYTRAIMDVLIPAAADLGYRPDAVVAGDEVPAGRPAPWMALKNAMHLGAYPLNAIVKVGDTVADIEEGLNAGMWTIGLAKTGNEIGLSEAEVAALPEEELESRLRSAYQRLGQAGAHYVVDGIGDVPAVIEEIERNLQA
jgi:phosphonoacetaldehyde hydrolase